jgi:hypothetical protein
VDGVQRVDRRRGCLAERGETIETGVVDKDVELFFRPALPQLAAELAREGGEAVVVGDVEGKGDRGPPRPESSAATAFASSGLER